MDVEQLAALDRTLRSTWDACEQFLRECLRKNDKGTRLPWGDERARRPSGHPAAGGRAPRPSRARLLLLASRPDLLAPLAGMRAARQLVDRADSSVVGIGYSNGIPYFYETILLHAVLTRDPALAFWTDLPDKVNRYLPPAAGPDDGQVPVTAGQRSGRCPARSSRARPRLASPAWNVSGALPSERRKWDGAPKKRPGTTVVS
jgi:hypothetical protein